MADRDIGPEPAVPMSNERLAEIKYFRLGGGHYDRTTDELVKEVERLRDAECGLDHDWAKAAIALLSALVDPKPCAFNGNNGCQIHGFTPGGNCPHANARFFLAGAQAHLRAGGGAQ